jgi:hypothetical protein
MSKEKQPFIIDNDLGVNLKPYLPADARTTVEFSSVGCVPMRQTIPMSSIYAGAKTRSSSQQPTLILNSGTKARPLRNSVIAWCGWHGRSLPCAGHASGPHRRYKNSSCSSVRQSRIHSALGAKDEPSHLSMMAISARSTLLEPGGTDFLVMSFWKPSMPARMLRLMAVREI